MLTGSYVVRDVSCHMCDSYIGWKYLEAENFDEKYKEGSYVIEIQSLEKEQEYNKKTPSDAFKSQ